MGAVELDDVAIESPTTDDVAVTQPTIANIDVVIT